MCRSDVEPQAQHALAELVRDMRDALAAEWGADPADVIVGPVDFGEELLDA